MNEPRRVAQRILLACSAVLMAAGAGAVLAESTQAEARWELCWETSGEECKYKCTAGSPFECPCGVQGECEEQET